MKESNLIIATYNVLLEPEPAIYPVQERFPLLLAHIVQTDADIIALQEVSDEFLSYLHSDKTIEVCYQTGSVYYMSPVPVWR
jgi:endonuclease/exonuclease/phosphatase family metal-dependent hydrolase